jgi:hypothetical protein
VDCPVRLWALNEPLLKRKMLEKNQDAVVGVGLVVEEACDLEAVAVVCVVANSL